MLPFPSRVTSRLPCDKKYTEAVMISLCLLTCWRAVHTIFRAWPKPFTKTLSPNSRNTMFSAFTQAVSTALIFATAAVDGFVPIVQPRCAPNTSSSLTFRNEIVAKATGKEGSTIAPVSPIDADTSPVRKILVQNFVSQKQLVAGKETAATSLVTETNRSPRKIVGRKSITTAAAELALFVYVGIELTLHGCAFFFVHEATKLFNIYFDTMLFSYLSWTKKGETDQKLYTFFAIQHLFFLAVKFVSPSLYLLIFETKHMIPALYYMATFFECVAYVNVLIQVAMRNIPTMRIRQEVMEWFHQWRGWGRQKDVPRIAF